MSRFYSQSQKFIKYTILICEEIKLLQCLVSQKTRRCLNRVEQLDLFDFQFFLVLNKAWANLDFEVKVTEISSKLSE